MISCIYLAQIDNIILENYYMVLCNSTLQAGQRCIVKLLVTAYKAVLQEDCNSVFQTEKE